jgi:integrase
MAGSVAERLQLMATIINRPNGSKAVQFVDPQNVRRTVSLGEMTRNAASRIALHVGELLKSIRNGTLADDDTEAWKASLPLKLRNRFAEAGLMPGKVPSMESFMPETLGQFLESYIEMRSDLKPASKTKLQQTKNKLLAFFGAERPLKTITAGDADAWRIKLAESLADNSLRRHCGLAKQFFTAAIRRELIQKNPFADLVCAVKRNTARYHFISVADSAAILEHCPNDEWRLLFALARYGGLRVPSEVMALRWSDIDWQRNRFTVHSPKTEHHEGKESRVVPIFPELRPYLNTAWDLTESRQNEANQKPVEFVISKHRNSPPVLRRQLERIIKAAGLKQWPKLWQNLRSTRETELCETFPIHVACEWIGNSEAVAKQHYLQVTEDHMTRAAVSPVLNVTSPGAAGEKTGPAKDSKPVQRAATALQTGRKPTEIDRNGSLPPIPLKPMKNPGKHGKRADFPGFINGSSGDEEWALRDSNRFRQTWINTGET